MEELFKADSTAFALNACVASLFGDSDGTRVVSRSSRVTCYSLR